METKITISELKAEIIRVRSIDAGWSTNPENNFPKSQLPKVYLVGHVGQKTHLCVARLNITSTGKLEINFPSANCGSNRYNTRGVSINQITGTHTVTCKKCGAGEVDLDKMNEKYSHLFDMIGKTI